jgi:hypothetical protein
LLTHPIIEDWLRLELDILNMGDKYNEIWGYVLGVADRTTIIKNNPGLIDFLPLVDLAKNNLELINSMVVVVSKYYFAHNIDLKKIKPFYIGEIIKMTANLTKNGRAAFIYTICV